MNYPKHCFKLCVVWLMFVLGVMVLVLCIRSDRDIESDRLRERIQDVLKT